MAVLFALLLGTACWGQLGPGMGSQGDAAKLAAAEARLAGGLPLVLPASAALPVLLPHSHLRCTTAHILPATLCMPQAAPPMPPAGPLPLIAPTTPALVGGSVLGVRGRCGWALHLL